MSIFICGNFDDGKETACKHCKHFVLWGVSTGLCLLTNDDIQSNKTCERFEAED